VTKVKWGRKENKEKLEYKDLLDKKERWEKGEKLDHREKLVFMVQRVNKEKE
jgi:Ni/Co efflux regulator RcnB